MRRLVPVTARISSLDLAKLEQKAEAEDCSISEYIRKRVIEVIGE